MKVLVFVLPSGIRIVGIQRFADYFGITKGLVNRLLYDSLYTEYTRNGDTLYLTEKFLLYCNIQDISFITADGLVLSSSREICKYYNITHSCFVDRYMSGDSVETIVYSKIAFNDMLKYTNCKSLGEYVTKMGYGEKEYNCIYKRLYYAKSFNPEMLNPYVNIRNRQDIVYVCSDGKTTFKSLKEMCIAHNVPMSTFYSRLEKYNDIPKALSSSRCVIFKGVKYKSVKDMCKAVGVCYQTYLKRRKSGMTVEESLSLDCYKRGKKSR